MKYLIPLLFITIIITSCLKVPRYIKQRFTYCYDGGNTNIDKLINIDGYYSMGIVSSYKVTTRENGELQTINAIDTLYLNFMFWSDGIFLNNFGSYSNTAAEYLNRVVENSEKSFYKRHYWGRYVINNDTIKAQYIDNPFPNIITTRSAYEVWYKVISRNELKYLGSNPLFRTSEEQYTKSEKARTYLPAIFNPVSVKPGSDCWLKKKNWFSCKNTKEKVL
jgi:hypothetical protein